MKGILATYCLSFKLKGFDVSSDEDNGSTRCIKRQDRVGKEEIRIGRHRKELLREYTPLVYEREYRVVCLVG